jgi:HK97 gp10 family phage protein
MNVTVEVQGKEEFAKTLLALAKALPNDKVEPVMLEGAKTVAAAAKAKAPQGPTGNLRKAVKAKQLKQISNYPRSAAAAVDRKVAPHSYIIEYGTKPRHQKSGRYTGLGPARPFFRPAVDANREPVYRSIRDKFLNMIVEAARK